MGPTLAAVAGPLEGGVVAIEEELSIGRAASNRLVIDDPLVAERQCLVKKEGERFTLWDVGSPSGTFVNGLPANGLTLRHGDQVRIGTSLFVVRLHPEPDAAASPVQFGDLTVGSTLRLRREAALNVLVKPAATASTGGARAGHDLQALLRISAALSSVRGLAALERPLLELVFDVIPAERGAILLAGKQHQEFESLLSRDRGRGHQTPIQVSRTIAERALQQVVGILSNDVRASGDPSAPVEHAGQEQASGDPTASIAGQTARRRSVLAVPMVAFDRVLGVIYLESTGPHARFDEGHLQVLTVIGGIAGVALDNLRQIERLESENRVLRAQVDVAHDMVGNSPKIRDIYRFVSKVAATDSTVLIRGESGTGKELVARAIHRNSPRARRPFVAINCAAITETLLESELFGHERGAFTGAVGQKNGKLEVADGGTVLLDEISELPLALQPKLLRVLQEREFDRVGATRPTKVDIRVIAATNVDLDEAVAAGRFRADLYYRLNVVSLTMPPLRDHREDIPALATHFAAKFREKTRRQIVGIAPEAEALMMQYDWPGNVRELENAIERALVLGSTSLILPEDLPEAVLESPRPEGAPLARYHDVLRRVKRDLIVKAVEQAGGNYVEAAKLLGLNPTYLHRLIRVMDLKAALKKLT
jgi:transcriptional regulator with GAF, ATPase, and Fis domain